MFQAPKLTNAGKTLYYENMAGAQLVFTTIKMGSGRLSGSIANMTDLVKTEVTITAVATANDGYVDVAGAFSNADMADGFYWREIGVFAANPTDPDNRAADILYCYQNAYDTADFIPAASVETVEKNITVPVIVGDASTVSCTLTKSQIFATVKDLEDHNGDPDAHAGLRSLVEETAQAVVAAAGVAQGAKETADAALAAANAAGQKADDAMGAAEQAQETADAALDAITKLAHTIEAVPSQNGTLTYTGGAQSPSWNSYNPETLVMGGTTSGTNAGTYTATFTPQEGYTWSDGTAETRSVTWTIGRASISATPSQSGSLTYNGGAQSPAWNSYNAAQLTMGGDTSGTNAGTYTATFTPTGNYQWSDGATTARSAGWTIAKAAGSLSIDKTSMTLTNGALTGTITVTRAGDGVISAVSSNTAVATVSVSGNTVTVTGKAYGDATITVSVAAGTNHTAPASKTCSAAVKLYNTTLNANSWAQIREVADAGTGANYWSVGDAKTITINGTVGNTAFSNLAVDVFILGFNHNSTREGTNRIHFQIGKISGTPVGLCDANYGNSSSSAANFQMNASNTNGGGWNGSSMRTGILGNSGTPTSPPASSLLAALPSDLRAVMKACTKYSDNTGGGSDTAGYVTATTDYLFLLAEWEYHGVRSYANSAEKNFQAQYPYYQAGNSKIKYKHNATGTAAYSWCRSVSAGSTNYFCRVNTDGSAISNTAIGSWALAPGFCA